MDESNRKPVGLQSRHKVIDFPSVSSTFLKKAPKPARIDRTHNAKDYQIKPYVRTIDNQLFSVDSVTSPPPAVENPAGGPLTAMPLITHSLRAVIVRLGFTLRFTGTIEPSAM